MTRADITMFKVSSINPLTTYPYPMSTIGLLIAQSYAPSESVGNRARRCGGISSLAGPYRGYRPDTFPISINYDISHNLKSLIIKIENTCKSKYKKKHKFKHEQLHLLDIF